MQMLHHLLKEKKYYTYDPTIMSSFQKVFRARASGLKNV